MMAEEIPVDNGGMQDQKIIDSDEYRKTLRAALSGGINFGTLVSLGRAPLGYQVLRLTDSDIKLPLHVVKKATTLHKVKMETIERLPDLLAHPVFVFRSRTDNNALVAIVDEKDTAGSPVLVSIPSTPHYLWTKKKLLKLSDQMSSNCSKRTVPRT
jgi:hypothetical protein